MINETDILIALIVAAVAAWLAGFPAARLGRRLRIIDTPKNRSCHTVPTPRTGGMAILPGALIGIAICFRATPAFLLAAGVGALVAAISFLDDLFDLRSLPRLIVHLVVTTAAVYIIDMPVVDLGLPYLDFELPHLVGMAIAILFVVAFVNFFNFMDGINGLAAAQGILGGLALAMLLRMSGVVNSVVVASALAGACLGFLPHNFPRAKIFMGDMASTTIGFSLAMLTLVGATRGPTSVSWIAMLLPLGVFIYDATFTLIKRIIRGENFIKPHREHHYQLLIRCGWSHTRVTLLQMGLMVMCCAGAFIYAAGSDALRLVVLTAVFAVLATYSVLVHRYFARNRKDAPAESVSVAQGRTLA